MTSSFFLGACTPQCFLSYADTLFDELSQLYIIKGGSGCGKSTFMRRIGAEAEARGLDVSYILCSSDPGSLDGVLLPALSVGFVDGTAPHVLEPRLCGGGANYLNFGEFYDEAGLRANAGEIRLAQRENAAQYPHVIACLAAADRVLESVRAEIAAPRYAEEMDAIAQCLALSALRPVGDKPRIRQRFLEAVTPEGGWFCAETPAALCRRVYVLRDDYLLAPQLLNALLQRAEALGHECIVCHSPLQPKDAPAHLLIPTADAAFVCDSEARPYEGEAFCRIDLSSTLPPALRTELQFCLDTTHTLLKQAVSHMHRAKHCHDRVEELCRPFVDFSGVDRLTEKTLKTLFNES